MGLICGQRVEMTTVRLKIGCGRPPLPGRCRNDKWHLTRWELSRVKLRRAGPRPSRDYRTHESGARPSQLPHGSASSTEWSAAEHAGQGGPP